MSFEVLSFLAEPWFVIPWYAVGVIGAAAVIYDLQRHNTPVKQAIAWGWPIIVLFFSVIGLALYYFTARAPHIQDIESREAKQKAHDRYQQNMFRRVNGAVIHCVAGDGLGIMTAMVIARLVGMSFWQEFWFEYLVGFLFGWLIFQLKSMTRMTDSLGSALAMAFRAEFFSMLTVMAGMGAVMTYVTPTVVTMQPKPLTYAFWGFGMLGLLAGYVCTYPMNWMMVRLGWKHGMGSPEGARPIEATAPRVGLLTAMVVLGCGALLLPAWLTEVRNRRTAEPRPSSGQESPADALAAGVRSSLETAARSLQDGRRQRATTAADAAFRAARIGREAAPQSGFAAALETIRRARHALQMGDPERARQRFEAAAREVGGGPTPRLAVPPDPARYEGATVVDARGSEIGEITAVGREVVSLELGREQDVWGIVDLGSGGRANVPVDALVFGPAGAIGPRLVASPSGPR